MGDICADETGKALLDALLKTVNTRLRDKTGDKPGDDEAYMKMVLSMPVKTLILIGVPAGDVDDLLARINGQSE
jgi:hypothetical protein